MAALSDITSEVRFRERLRGYDCDEVDSYLKAVLQAARQAEGLIAELFQQISELSSSKDNEQELDEHARDTLVRTLVLAQRTADAAIAEAKAESKSMISAAEERSAKTVGEAEAAANSRLLSAEERAAQMLAEADENCRLIIAETKRIAATEMAEERERVVAVLEALETKRSELLESTSTLEARLKEQREAIHSLLESFRSFVDDIDANAVLSKLHVGEDRVEAAPQDDPGREAALAEPQEQSRSGATEGEPVAPQPATQLMEQPPTELMGPPFEISPSEAANGSHNSGNDGAGDTEPLVGATGEVGDADHDADPGTTGETTPERDVRDLIVAPDPEMVDISNPELSTESAMEVPVVYWQGGESDDLATAAVRTVSAGDIASQTALPSDDTGRHDEPALHTPPHSGVRPFASERAQQIARDDSPLLLDMDAEDDDEFIEQLRKVLSNDEPLPDTDAAMAAFFDPDDRGTGGPGVRVS